MKLKKINLNIFIIAFFILFIQNQVKSQDYGNLTKIDTISKNSFITKTNNDSLNEIVWNGKFGEYVDIRDGKIYKIVKIQNQIWFAQNLAYKPEKGKYFPYQNEEENIAKLGYLYVWETAQSVCPNGWHIPDTSEFNKLLQNVNRDFRKAYNELSENGNSGFTILPSGFGGGILFTQWEKGGIAFWSSTIRSKKNAYALSHGRFIPITNIDSYAKFFGLYIRCLKNN